MKRAKRMTDVSLGEFGKKWRSREWEDARKPNSLGSAGSCADELDSALARLRKEVEMWPHNFECRMPSSGGAPPPIESGLTGFCERCRILREIEP